MQKNGDLDERKIVADMMTSYSESYPKKKLSEEVFSKWNPRSDSNTETPNRYLDQIVTDESVTDILYTYFIPNTIPWSGVYDYMESEGLDGFLVEDQMECTLSGQQKSMAFFYIDLMMT